ncbi:MAG: hypothetical protein GY898_11790 [Proteobacteria bacterium]|nr:hypothetical protein [Pseudomonadota bacterium]
MGTGPTASETKRNVLRVLLVEGSQSVKLVVDPEKLDTLSGFPDRVITGYDDGIPLDLNPAWPLELDLDDPISLGVSLSFGGQVCRCRVAWAAITTVAVGLGGVRWEHEDHDPSPPAAPPPQTASGTHLRVVK